MTPALTSLPTSRCSATPSGATAPPAIVRRSSSNDAIPNGSWVSRKPWAIQLNPGRFSQRLEKVPGIGPLTASALVASIGDAKNFDNGRQFAAWLGVVPRQHSSGGKPTLLGMSKRGDAYLRTMLIHGARSVIYRTTQRAETNSWLVKLTTRRNKNIAAVAMANKTARTVWAPLAHGREFKAGYAVA
jgi:Transposase IS116/IS110/IS902 family